MNSDFATRLINPTGVWPWAEHNQGLLSAVALAAALAIALYEIRQTARRDLHSLVEYIDWVLNCADRSIELTDDAIRYIDTDGQDAEGVAFPVWQFLNGNALATLEEIQPLRPAHPRLTHYVNRLMRAIGKELQASAFPTYNREILEHFKTLVVIERDHIAALRPRTLGQGLRDRLRAFTSGRASAPAR